MIDYQERNNIRNSTIDYLNNHLWDTFVTLTFRYPVNKDKAEKVVWQFLKDLKVTTFGKSSRKNIQRVVAIEKHKAIGVHIHILFIDPTPNITTHRIDNFYFKESVRRCWENADKSTAFVRISCPDDQQWFKKVEDSGVIRYITKEILNRGHMDVIAWELSNFSGRIENGFLRSERNCKTG